MTAYVIPLERLGMGDIDMVGGKNASLGEMIGNLSALGVKVPGGFATTAQAYRDFLLQDGLGERIRRALENLDVDDVARLAETGAQVREWIRGTPLPARLLAEAEAAWRAMAADTASLTVAVRSSATAEDLPDASFAGQQETFLNVQGFDGV
ncbi:MAG: phosphoenolpyruvate synthase, partial [Gammaproteobacteria bacterium]|nr:phosphoenolpyruvate synthase [Gammaproteobacteria bacterium]